MSLLVVCLVLLAVLSVGVFDFMLLIGVKKGRPYWICELDDNVQAKTLGSM